ncbi:hypothetical protein [Endozoicomonas numazuensis]|uniref:Uncharacterized protein n=1 Tax=Endozoicomonas numazuensis TaxID=1137799 RepID=A0A081NHM2_9GAMM|nr:hypothetical protein [Endozoicomonas numazuensis]KEQ17945.1 hypothetical protein GZ78_10020 [Endozoicomonas numazuensis]
MHTCAIPVSPQAFTKALALISLLFLSHLAYSGDAEKSAILVMDCPASHFTSPGQARISTECKAVPGIIVGLHWIAVPTSQLEHCHPKANGKPNGVCAALPKGIEGIALLASSVWEYNVSSSYIYPIVTPEQGGFPIERKALQLTLLEMDGLHEFLGYNRDLKVASLDFNETQNLSGTLVTLNAPDCRCHYYPAAHPAKIPAFHKFSPGLLGLITPRLGKVENQLGYFGAYSAPSKKKKTQDPNALEPINTTHETSIFFYPDMDEKFKRALMTRQDFLGHIAYTSYMDGPDSIYFARLKYNETFMKRVMSPWYWEPYTEKKKPPKKGLSLAKDTKTLPKSRPAPCKDLSGNLGTVNSLSRDQFCTFISRQGEIIHLSEGFHALTGSPGDSLQWIRWQDTIPGASKILCDFSAEPNCDGGIHISVGKMDCLSEGLTRFGDQRLSHWHDPHVAMLCRVAIDEEYFIGRRSEVNDQCTYIRPVIEDGEVKELIEYSEEFEVVSFKKRPDPKTEQKAIDKHKTEYKAIEKQ